MDRIEIITQLLKTLPVNLNDINYQDTPRRVAEMWDELVWPKETIEKELQSIFSRVFDEKYQELVFASNIPVSSVCPHHLLPVIMEVSVGYIPRKKVLGLSKLVRFVYVLSRQPVLQEAFTDSVTQTLVKYLNPKGAGCLVKGTHTCMWARGVERNVPIYTYSFYGDINQSLFFNLSTTRLR